MNFTIQGPWKVAIGVHPKHYDTLTVEKTICNSFFTTLVALGECGLDRTINPSQWCRQEEVFVRLLKLCRIEQPLVLHLRCTKGDLYSSDVHGRCLLLMEDVCDPLQKIHVHCFMGRSDVVNTWLRKFPNTYFYSCGPSLRSETARRATSNPSKQALTGDGCALFSFRMCHGEYSGLPGRRCSIPVEHLNIRPPELMRTTVRNARNLYG